MKTFWDSIACAAIRQPPIARCSSSFDRSRSSAPARTTCRTSAATQLLHDPGHVVWADTDAIAVVDGHDRRPAAGAEAFDGAERYLAVFRGLAGTDAELALERVEHAL